MGAINMHDTIKASIVGQLIGDAVGYPYSNRQVPAHTINMIAGPDGEEPGTYQGPSSLSLCTMASINELQEIDLHDIMEKFNDFMIAGYLGASDNCSDLSEITIAAIKNHLNGITPDRCGLREDERNDNECLARILPIGLYLAPETNETIIRQSHKVCKITHAHVKSQVVCALYCLIIRGLLLQKTGKVFDLLEEYYAEQKMEEYTEALSDLKNADKVIEESENGRSVDYCFWGAWTSHSKFENDYKLCLTNAVSLGGDANSIGAVAGGISGLVNGLSNIPPPWMNTIKLSTEVMETINAFIDGVIRKIQPN